MTVHLDVTQLVADPWRSGIQRTERELIRHWPGPQPLALCRFDPHRGRMQVLPDRVTQVLCDDASDRNGPALTDLLASGEGFDGPEPSRLLNAELFGDARRATYYQGRPASCRAYWLVYDFLPLLHPEWFSLGSALRLMDYVAALRTVQNVAFISERTRDDFTTRVHRRAFDGPVMPLGADGLGLERQRFTPERRSFVMLGTIEPRKNALGVMAAFQLLWNRGLDADLVMIGAVSPDAAEELSMLAALAGRNRFTHFPAASDHTVREALRHARAVVFPSEGEGFGLPPLEALHAGIPVIVSEHLPGLAHRESLGQVRLRTVGAESIADAVCRLMDDQVCRALWRDAAIMPLPGWAEFAAAMAALGASLIAGCSQPV